MVPFEIAEPRSLDEAMRLLAPGDDTVRPAAGFTALMLMMKASVFTPTRLVSLQKIEKSYADISAIPGGGLRIGALASLAEIEHSEPVQRAAPVIRRAMQRLANVRVRNVARLGGSLAHGDPHMDLPPVLAALGAVLTVKGPSAMRQVELKDLYRGYYQTSLRRDELITFVDVPPQEGWSTVYLKCTTRSADDWPALGIACSLRRQGGGTIADARIVASAAIDRMTRLSGVEAELRGASPSDAVLTRAAEAGLAETKDKIIEDARGSAAYKAELMRVYIKRCLQEAVRNGARA